MKQVKVILLVIVISNFLFSCHQQDKSSIIAKVNNALQELDTIEYDFTYQVIQQGKKVVVDSSLWHFDFTQGDNIKDLKFHTLSLEGEMVFNGDSTFIAQPQIETIILRDAEEICTPLQFSLFPFRKLLPKFINDPDIFIHREKDTTITNTNYYVLKLDFKNKNIDANCEISEVQGSNFEYTLVIDKDTYLPKLIRLPKLEDQIIYLSFDKIKNTGKKSENFWNGNELPKNYIRMDSKTYGESRQKQLNSYIGKTITSWELPELYTEKGVNLSKKQGSMILLYFWFPNCPPCIAAQPELNEIYGKYQEKNLNIYGIEYTNINKEKLIDYIDKQKINYPILYNGKIVASVYKINTAPTMMLIDKSGTIIYAEPGFNKKEIIKLIEENT